MAYTGVTLPLTGAGDATAAPAVDLIGGLAYQAVKLFDGLEGSTLAVLAKQTTPGSIDAGLITRPIASTAFSQAIVGAVGITSGSVGISSGSSAVELTSAGSTRLAGRFSLENPTTAVTVDGSVSVLNQTTAVSLSSQHTVTVGNPTTAVTVSSGVVLGAGSSANMLGQVFASGTTKVDVSSGVVLGAGSSANMLGQVQATGTTQVDVSSGVILAAGSSANVLGAVAQGPGSSANFWFRQSIPFSSANITRTTVNTSVDASIIAANANRKALIIQNLTTVEIGIGLSTGAVSTALANVAFTILGRGNAEDAAIFGGGARLPLWTGPIRGITIGSTTVSGGVAVVEFT